ncbi:MAG: hypothetical protein HETSPECPRED_005378 [Heterodermia speciosa]|uniref:Uncharacterized protein n=1 Tax=Heterodermia speciosa TaxID=116794 RepID=A0A8H3FFK2_9LECA|nr:MAG: hypothetical protein HETSPECPRED_005378 [Heterodermia speciosa]
MTQDNANFPTNLSPEFDVMEDLVMGGTTEANNEPQPLLSSVALSASPVNKCTADSHQEGTGQDVLQVEADRFAFDQRVQKLLIDLEDEIGVDILLMSGSHDDPECLAVKAIWVERRRMEELMVKTQELHIRK